MSALSDQELIAKREIDSWDLDPAETSEWLDALSNVLHFSGGERTRFLLEKLNDWAHAKGVDLPLSAQTGYVNTIAVADEPHYPGNKTIEGRIRSYIRWNALAMVVKANRKPGDVGGHISSFASSAVLYDVGYNHFFRGSVRENEETEQAASAPGDLVYFQGHSSPGIYARAFLEGRLSAEQLDRFRTEVDGGGLSSYPHPWLMKDFWQFPTVSMGLGPIMAIYQARFMRYLEHRGLLPVSDRKVWAYMGDGEMDEPESLGSISLAVRERLDNLIFVINCNLQRLDGPVRGNGKIIQELEAMFRGAGWNVIKVLWGENWDRLLAKDTSGLLSKRMAEALDGDYQDYRSKSGGYIREHFFGKYPELLELVADMSDEDIWRLTRGGHDVNKVYAAYRRAYEHRDQPTVILAKTIKGYGMGAAGQSKNIAHQQKKLAARSLIEIKNRFHLPLTDEQAEELPYLSFAKNSEEYRYLQSRLEQLGGSVPQRKHECEVLEIPDFETVATGLLDDSGDRELSTTMAFVRVLNNLIRQPALKERIVPIVADESRTFGMEGMFRQLGIYSLDGQQYRPEDADILMYYREDKKGQILQEGICEAGAMASWIAASTSYSNYSKTMIPFYIFYSMFGFQRIGDLAWVAGDSRARGFLLGGTSGRTTLNGEGLQHADGHSQLQAQLVPNCISYDPTFAYEVAVIIKHGLDRMYVQQVDEYYYLTLLNENYSHPAMPEDCAEDIIKGMYLFATYSPASTTTKKTKPAKPECSVDLLGCGSILREVIFAAEILSKYGVIARVWSAPGINIMVRQCHQVSRHNRLHYADSSQQQQSHLQQCLADKPGVVLVATDYVRQFADQLAPFIDRPFCALGTNGFGRSDTRDKLREFFEVNRQQIVYNTLVLLAKNGWIDEKQVSAAKADLQIDESKQAAETC